MTYREELPALVKDNFGDYPEPTLDFCEKYLIPCLEDYEKNGHITNFRKLRVVLFRTEVWPTIFDTEFKTKLLEIFVSNERVIERVIEITKLEILRDSWD